MQCKGCAYDKSYVDKGCIVFKKRPKKCWNYTTEEQAAKREKEIEIYSSAPKRP